MKVPTSNIWKERRDHLNITRASLFKKYSQNPENLDLALQIRKIDDEIAECTDKMSKETLSSRRALSDSIPNC